MKSLSLTRAGFLLAALLLLGGVRAGADEGYLMGGSEPLDPDLKARLDKYASVIRLGLNTDRIRTSGVPAKYFIECVLVLAKKAVHGEIPGAVLFIDSFIGDNMPIGIGHRITDPEERDAEWDTYYELGTLTGIVVVTPLVLRAIDQNRLNLADEAGAFLEEFRGSPLEHATIETLLRHSTGLPGEVAVPNVVRTRAALLKYVREIKLEAEPGTRVIRSGLNFLILGLILEELEGMPVHDLARQVYIDPLGMVNTAQDIPIVWLSRTAPGEYSDWLGRMAWGEAADPAAFILGSSGGNGGLITLADDLSIYAKTLMFAYRMGLDDLFSSDTLRISLQPDPDLIDGEDQGLGWALNGIGDGSFGWDGDTGCSLWIEPEMAVFAIILSNSNHPMREKREESARHPKALSWIQMAFKKKGPHAMLLPAPESPRGRQARRGPSPSVAGGPPLSPVPAESMPAPITRHSGPQTNTL